MLSTIIVSIIVILALNAALALSAIAVRLGARHRSISDASVERRWSPRIHALLAGETSPATLAPLIRRSDRRSLTYLLAGYGQRVSGVELERIRAIGRPLLPHAEPELRKRHAETRAAAIQIFGILGGSAEAETIAAMLEDESPLVAMVAARWLTQMDDDRFAPPVLDRLDRLELWSPAFLASMLAGGGPPMAGHLRAALESDLTAAQTRAVAADALRLLHDPESADVAAAVLEGVDDREVAAACLRLLETIGTSGHADVVRGFATGDDFVLRALGVTALGAIGAGEGDVDIVDEALDDPSPWVSLHAARALHAAGRLDALQRAAVSGRAGAAAAAEVLAGVPG